MNHLILCCTVLFYSALTFAKMGETEVTWLGHAAFKIKTPQGQILLVDPWLNNPSNPQAGKGKDPVAQVKKLDYILVTHGHSDHVGEAVQLAKKTQAKLVTNFDLGTNMVRVLGFPKKLAGIETLINPGGEIEVADGEILIAMTPAIHSSGIDDPKGAHPVAYGGNPGGFIIRIKDGPTIYHSGDTAYFKDMEVIGETYAPDLALLNIGGHFGMSPAMAIKAAAAIHAKYVVPHHFKTFPLLTQDPASFVQGVTQQKQSPIVMEPGTTLKFDKKELKKDSK